jgi:hypothetical protein
MCRRRPTFHLWVRIHPSVDDLRLRVKLAGLYGPVYTLKHMRAARRMAREPVSSSIEPGGHEPGTTRME